jgi:hypothetical protein
MENMVILNISLTVLHSRPYYGYDARMDPTLLNSVRNKLC